MRRAFQRVLKTSVAQALMGCLGNSIPQVQSLERRTTCCKSCKGTCSNLTSAWDLLNAIKHRTWNSTFSECIDRLIKVLWYSKGVLQPEPQACELPTPLPSNRKHHRVVFTDELTTLSPVSSEHFPEAQEVLASKILSWCTGQLTVFTCLFLS